VNPLGPDGFVTKVQYGAHTGLQEFFVTYNPLPGFTSGNTITFGGVMMTKAAYIRDFFDRHTISGIPFVIQCIENSQYYLVRFNDSQQTLTRKFAASYATDVNFIQERRYGVTVFDPLQLSGLWGWYDGDSFVPDDGSVMDKSTGNHNLVYGGDVLFPGTQNGHKFARFNSVFTPGGPDPTGISPSHDSEDPPARLAPAVGGMMYSTAAPVIKEAVFAVQINEATFSSYAGLLTANSGTAAIVGESGTTKFYNLAFSNYEYSKNGVDYIATNQQAPMSAWGVIHCRWPDGVGLTHLQIGRDRDFGTRYQKMDFGEGLLFTTLQPLSTSRELLESVATRWAVGG
jgi:hypothetical protein